ncbi:hypothetical protein PTKIN_Ptkin03bG0132500 [Pterospermum kingtungense]
MKPEDKSKRKKRAYEGDEDKKDKDMWEIREKRFPSSVIVLRNTKSIRSVLVWTTPSPRCAKFNVYGFSLGKPGLAELFAIRKTFILYISSRWVKDLSLIVESDSRNAVGWVNNPLSTPWRLKHLINHIENLKLLLPEWQVSHIYRECNSIANNLAKDGVNRTDNLLYVIDP